MSLDNVLAIVAAAHGSTPLIIFGLIVSIPLVVAGSHLILKIIDKFPALIWIGAALIGWVAGEILSGDTLIADHEPSSAILIIGLVVCIPLIINFSSILNFFLRYPALIWLFGAGCGWIGHEVTSNPAMQATFADLPLHNMTEYLSAFGAIYVVGLAWLIERRSHVPAAA